MFKSLQFGPECDRDYLLILSGEDSSLFRNKDDLYLGHYCGTKEPTLGHPILSKANEANVLMVTKFGSCPQCKGFSLKFLAGNMHYSGPRLMWPWIMWLL